MIDQVTRIIMRRIINAGGTPYLVGGYVRDTLLELAPKDVDIEVYNMSYEELVGVLGRFGDVDTVGKSFGVIKLGHYDFSLPRKDSKVADGHRGFEVTTDSSLTLQEAASRRDFTINAMSMDVEGNIVDPHGGQQDLHNKVLRATSSAFAEDPLRVLRGFQFAGRFGLTVDENTASLCSSLLPQYSSLSLDRIRQEWIKWATKSTAPSNALHFLVSTKWISAFFPIFQLIGCPQDPEWHPEGDVFEHTCHVLDAAAQISARERLNKTDRMILMFAALCHDFGKSVTTSMIDGRWRAPGHDKAGGPIARSFMESIGFNGKSGLGHIVDQVISLVENHMVHIRVDPTDRMVRRLAKRLEPANIDILCHLIEADHSGRPPLDGGLPDSANQIREIARDLLVQESPPSPILMGRHLVELGHKPGPEMGQLLKKIYDLQLDGVVSSLEECLEKVEQ